MAHLITGYAGIEHIKSEDQGSFNASFFGTGEFVMEIGKQFKASITSNNTVRILDGDLLMQGRHIRINPNTNEDLTIESGTSGTNRIDLIVMTYEKDNSTGVESATIEVVKGTPSSNPSAPTIITGNILSGELKNQMPLYKVYINGVVLSSIEKVFKTCPTYKALAEKYEQEFIDACENYLDSLNVIDTVDGILANTSENQLTGALATKNLIDEMFMIREVEGTMKAGANTMCTIHIPVDWYGYTPIGIVGCELTDDNNKTYLNSFNLEIDSNNIYRAMVKFYQGYSSANNTKIKVRVLYNKNVKQS